MARGNGTGRELAGKFLHLQHLLLSPLPHLMLHLILSLAWMETCARAQQTLAHLLDLHLRHLLHLPHFLVASHWHLQHLLLHRFQLKVLMRLVPLLHLLLTTICTLPLSPSVGQARSSSQKSSRDSNKRWRPAGGMSPVPLTHAGP